MHNLANEFLNEAHPILEVTMDTHECLARKIQPVARAPNVNDVELLCEDAAQVSDVGGVVAADGHDRSEFIDAVDRSMHEPPATWPPEALLTDPRRT